ncbi:LysR family transcriptional regulator [Microvirga sp. TS319]|uniref:LysR family transcriptional regulator n=1 Tax=Microvirga sp. TS319 TaxID=3241165 RepID=UPI00351A89A2
MLDLKQMRCFVAVAEESHVTRAAERLGMQQPPLSAQIKAIEDRLGLRLFLRKARGVELTEAGRVLLTEVRDILARLDRAVERTRSTARGEMGQLSLGIAPTAPFHPLVPQSIRRFRETLSAVTITLTEGLSHEIAHNLAREQIDVAFVRSAKLHDPDLLTIPLVTEPMVLALPAESRLAQVPGRVELAQCADTPFILIGPPGTGFHDETVSTCQAAGFSLRIAQQAPRMSSALGFVAAGLGVTLVPECLKSVQMEGVVYRYVSGPREPQAVLALALRKRDPSALLANFIRSVRSGVDEKGVR